MSPLAASLMTVLLAANALVLADRALPRSAWTPFVFIWQDVAVVLSFLVVERLLRRQWLSRAVYGALVLCIAVNVPVERELASPLTMPMLRAAGGPLADSIRQYTTPLNITLIGVVLTLGIAIPLLAQARWPRATPGTQRTWIAAMLAVVATGATGASRIDASGLDRNPLVALIQTARPRVPADENVREWRASPFDSGRATDHGKLTEHADQAVHAEQAQLAALSGAAAGRHVLMIVLESTGASYLRPYGAAEDPMPNLTALAEQSILFEHAYAVYPESIKGFVALLASRYPAFDVPVERHARVIAPSLATVLSTAGYETALFHSGRFMYLGMESLLAGSGFASMEDAGAIGGNRNSSFGIDEASTVRHMLGWIDRQESDRPFFIAYLPAAGHHPYAYSGERPFPDEQNVDRYRNALHEGDEALGELLKGLRQRDLLGITLIVVLGDHGEAFEQHAGNVGHTLALYEENVRVPLLVALPGDENAEPPSARVASVASLIDVAPTILDLLGLAPDSAFQGTTLLGASSRMALFFTDYSLGLLGLRDGCTKYIHELESGRSRMFDLCRDPGEQTDISAMRADRGRLYRGHLRAWSAAQVHAVRTISEPAAR